MSLNKFQDCSRELSRIHAIRSCITSDDAQVCSLPRRIRHPITFFQPAFYFPSLVPHSSRCAGDTNAKWNLIPPLCIFATPGVSLCFPLVGVSIIGHSSLPVDGRDCSLSASTTLHLIFVSHILGHQLYPRKSENNPFIPDDTRSRLCRPKESTMRLQRSTR